MENRETVGIGVIGCGGFGLYALQHFVQVPGVAIRGMAGTHREAAVAAARRFGLEQVEEVKDLVCREDIGIVYVATPPFLHHPQAMAALRAGKHVICEKPLALTLEQADEMIELAQSKSLLLVANLLQRYNPLFDIVRALVDSRVLGELLRATFENYASDEGLPPEHWFWDREKSGGIFVEHGVHFFDVFEGWLGHGRVASACATRRPGTEIEEHVRCTVRYGETAIVDFYHGFHQTGRLDRQELRLVFERGDVRLDEWIPVRAKVTALADEAQTRALCALFPGSRVDVLATYGPRDRACRGRHKDIDAFQLVELQFGLGGHKMVRYGELLRAFLADQVAWIRDRSHPRRITQANGRNSLDTAVEAARLARESELSERR
jgi:predicted dehydrogenase